MIPTRSLPYVIMVTLLACSSIQAIEFEVDHAANRRTRANKTFYKADTSRDYTLTEADGKAWEKYGELDTNADESVSFDEFLTGATLPYPKWDGEVQRNVIYKRVDNKVLLLDIYAPRVKKYEKAPVFYYTHGGGWSGGSKELSGAAKPLFQALSQEGFVCVSVMYRLVRANNPKDQTLMRDCVVDCRDGLRFLKKNETDLEIDLNKVVVFGGSAGGHIAQLLTWSGADDFIGDPDLTAHKVEILAGLSWYGPSDFRDTRLFVSEGVKDKFSPDHWAKRITKPSGKFRYEGADEETRRMIEEVSPVCYLKESSAPLLHIHGDQDPVISMTQAKHLEKEAKKIGAPVTVIYVKGGGHGWASHGIEPDRKTIDQRSIDFILHEVTK